MQALIWCGRLEDALQISKDLPDGLEKKYLKAECEWRSGLLDKSCNSLKTILHAYPDSQKCVKLLEYVIRLQDLIQTAEIAYEDGELSQIRSSCRLGTDM